jgi:ubiquinone biosynthesis protein Coq4
MDLSTDTLDVAAEAAAPAAGANQRTLDKSESQYMQGGAEPATSSVLISNSKYLNNPYYRDAFSQMALRRHGHDLPETYLIPHMIKAINEVKDYPRYFQLIEEEKQKKPEFAAWLKARRLTTYTPENTKDHAPGTLGAAIHEFVSASGMNMEFMLQGEITNDLDYITRRRVQNHDIEHMVTGFGPNQLGEEALAIMNVTAAGKYFSPELAQNWSDYNVFVSVCSYKRVSLHYPELLPAYLDAMKLGIEAGQGLKKPLPMIDWEDYLDWRVEDICADLGFRRGPGEAWDYSRDVARG